jgi:hypothetical protein
MVDNDNVETLRRLGYFGKRLVGVEREGKSPSRCTEGKGQGMRHPKLVVH